ncbi:MAG: flippase-like domain-containing protein [Candidatus Omnitrophica bacterium]|nr:flippase-like domain-containing protein [Candidatus Omnitrophota bacterium]
MQRSARMTFKSKLFLTIAAAAILYLLWCLWTGWREIASAFSSFQWRILPLCLLLAFGNYVVRFTKWHYYLSILNIPLRPLASFQVFLAGLVMSATPGKFGEVFKSYLVKEINQTPISRSAPIVFAERLTDFIAFLLMALLGVTLLPNGGVVFAVSIGGVAAVLILLSWKRAAEWTLARFARLPFLHNHADKLRTAYESAYLLIAPRPLLLATGVSLGSWFLECVAFYLVLWGFNYPLPIASATFIYAFGTIMGALLMTPGGIGPTEGAIGGLLMLLFEIPKGVAASATLIIRICTLWFAVAVGLVVLASCSRTFSAAADDRSLDSALRDLNEPRP